MNFQSNGHRWLLVALLLTIALLPLGIATAQDAAADGDAKPKVAADQKKQGDQASGKAIFRRIAAHLSKQGFSDEQLRPTLDVMKRIAHAMLSSDKPYELNAELAAHMKEQIGLTDAQIEMVVKLSRRAAPSLTGAKKKTDIIGGYIRRMQPDFEKQGFTHEQIQASTRVLRRIIPAMQKTDKKFEVSAKLSDYLVNEIGLSAAQIDYLISAAQQIAVASAKKSDKATPQRLVEAYAKLGVGEKAIGLIKKSLHQMGVDKGQMNGALGCIVRIVHQMQDEGSDYEMSPRLEEYFENTLKFDEKQVSIVEGIAEGIVAEAGDKHEEF